MDDLSGMRRAVFGVLGIAFVIGAALFGVDQWTRYEQARQVREGRSYYESDEDRAVRLEAERTGLSHREITAQRELAKKIAEETRGPTDSVWFYVVLVLVVGWLARALLMRARRDRTRGV